MLSIILHVGIEEFNKSMEKIIDQVKKASPGDIIIVKTTKPLTAEQRENVISQISMLDEMGAKFLLWAVDSLEIGVISKGFADDSDSKRDGTANK